VDRPALPSSRLAELLDRLEAAAGPADPVPSTDAWELVLAENVGYLVDDRTEVPETVPARQRAHQLLRRHGQTVCRRSTPECPQCPIADTCPSAGTTTALY
jgi:hypothetical protein